MRNRCGILSAVVFALGLLPLTICGTSPATAAKDFLGRWDITIANTGDTFFSSWLEVTESGGKLSGKLLWKWGSVTNVKAVEVVDRELQVTRTESYEDKPVDVVYRARLVDGKMVGSVKRADGSVRRFAGVRSVEKVDVSGTWQLEAQTPRRTMTLTLILNQEGSDISGKFVIPARDLEIPFQKGKLEGTALTFSVSFNPRKEMPWYYTTLRKCRATG